MGACQRIAFMLWGLSEQKRAMGVKVSKNGYKMKMNSLDPENPHVMIEKTLLDPLNIEEQVLPIIEST